MELLDSLKQKAKSLNKRIVLPEGYEERTIKAADIALEEGLLFSALFRDTHVNHCKSIYVYYFWVSRNN